MAILNHSGNKVHAFSFFKATITVVLL